jgi:transposase
VAGDPKIQHTRNEPRPIAQLVHQLVELQPARIVVESTGGYERTLVEKVAEAGLPVVVVNPRRVRSFGQALGILAKTDAFDARLLALWGESRARGPADSAGKSPSPGRSRGPPPPARRD